MPTSRRDVRRIALDRVTYEWRARYRRLPASASAINVDAFESDLVVFRAVPGGRAGCVVRLGPRDGRAVANGYVLVVPITPKLVRAAIEFALAHGWDSTRAAGFVEITGFGEPG